MNRVLYQLSYAAIGQLISFGEISFIIITKDIRFVKRKLRFFQSFFGKAIFEVNSMNLRRTLALFTLGGSAYVGLELLYRRRSHVSMFGAGGLCFLLMGRLNRTRLPIPARMGLGALTITGVELATGLLVNRDHHVWDYRAMPGNFRGQVCLPFTALWYPLSGIAMGLYDWADSAL